MKMRPISTSHCAIGQETERAGSGAVGCLSFDTGVATIPLGLWIVRFDSEWWTSRNDPMENSAADKQTTFSRLAV